MLIKIGATKPKITTPTSTQVKLCSNVSSGKMCTVATNKKVPAGYQKRRRFSKALLIPTQNEPEKSIIKDNANALYSTTPKLMP